MAVDRCICKKIPFSTALGIARHHGCATVAELQRYCELGTGCGLCVPYMQCSLVTGETDLPVLGAGDYEQWLQRSGLATEDGK